MFLNAEIRKEDIDTNIEELAHYKNLSYGIRDENDILMPDRIRKITVLYDQESIGKGIEVFRKEHCVKLQLALPSTLSEIHLFYLLIRYICMNEDLDCFYLNGKEEKLTLLTDLEKKGEEDSLTLIEKLKKKDCVVLQLAKHPVYLSKNDLNSINDICDFENILHHYQRNIVYSSPEIIYNDDEKIAIFPLIENENCVLPLKPYVEFLDDIKAYYIGFDDLSTICYNDFLENVEFKENFDVKHGIVCLKEDKISELVEKYAIDFHTNEKIKKNYIGSSIDDSHHMRKVKEKNFPLEEIAGFNHMAIFLRWSLEHHMISEKVLNQIPEITDKSTDLREIIMNHELFNGYLRTIHFKESGKEFVKEFYNFDSDGCFPGCVDLYAESYFGDHYDDEEFDTEAYLFVPYDENYYQGLSKYIDEAYEKFKEKKDEKE